jgi:Dolichyl-phosphate-mannose-protein mannosyltransferase
LRATVADRASVVRWTCGVLLAAVVALGCGYRIQLLCREPEVRADAAVRYFPLAKSLLAGHGLSYDQVAPFRLNDYEVPGYPAFLAAILALGGGSLRLVVAVQLFIELATLWLVQRIARYAGLGSTFAWTAAALGLGLLFLPSLAVELLTETLAIFASTLLCLCILRASKSTAANAVKDWALAGIVAGLAALVRVDTYAFVALGMLACMFSMRETSVVRRGRVVLIFAIAFGAVLLPWSLRMWSHFGTLEMPGQIQFRRAGNTAHLGPGFRLWMDTWADHGSYVELYVWGPLASRPSQFPADKVRDPVERARAEELYGAAKAEGVEPFNDKINAGFEQLALDARRDHWFERTILVAVRRSISCWLRMPSNTLIVGPSRWPAMYAVYSYWFVVLALAVFGVRRALGMEPATTATLLALILARTAIPFSSAWGVEVRYLYEAVPAVLVLASYGLSAIFEFLNLPVESNSRQADRDISAPMTESSR